MTEVHTISANKRDRAGKGAARATRREGHVPGVIYGNKQSPLLIALDPREIDREIHKKGFYTTLFDLKVGSDAHRVLARDIQFDPVTDRVLHADFMRVTDATRVRVHVPVAFTNEGLSPGIKRGGVLNVVRHDIEMYCSAGNIPQAITVDVAELDIGDSVHISMVKLPQGTRPVITDRDFTVASVCAGRRAWRCGTCCRRRTGQRCRPRRRSCPRQGCRTGCPGQRREEGRQEVVAGQMRYAAPRWPGQSGARPCGSPA
jgi:large subunit ribosomal protein L25